MSDITISPEVMDFLTRIAKDVTIDDRSKIEQLNLLFDDLTLQLRGFEDLMEQVKLDRGAVLKLQWSIRRTLK